MPAEDVLPRIGLTMGDPAGVGPELIVRALAEEPLRKVAQCLVFGEAPILERAAAAIGVTLPSYELIPLEELSLLDSLTSQRSVIVDIQAITEAEFDVGQCSAACGLASYRYIQAAMDAACAHQISAITTGPINKYSLSLANIAYPGHTEMFAERSQSNRWCMMQYSEKITCSFVTVHCGYAEVPQLLSTQKVLDTIELTAEAIQRIRGREAVIAVCGLNPHAGEDGLFGNGEEEQLIAPAIQAAQSKGIQVHGPLPPDTVFIPSKLAMTDAIVCMYHDQGHIPVKALAFDQSVNTTLGVDMIRTSVDHGTAFDIAWQGKADPSSLFAAIRLAAKLS